MNAPESAKLYDPGLESTRERADLLASSGDDAPKTQIIAIYGKGGIGAFYQGGTALMLRQGSNWASRQGLTDFANVFQAEKPNDMITSSAANVAGSFFPFTGQVAEINDLVDEASVPT